MTPENATSVIRKAFPLILAVSLGVLSVPSDGRAGGSLDVARWLDRPGVRLLAVELYATWCKPCMAAVPRWKALHEKYRKEGLRLVVVATQDPGGACTNPGWSPDEVVCDDDGVIAKALGAGDTLPAAFLWTWQGQLLVRKGHVDEVEGAIKEWMRSAPRVEVDVREIAKGAGITKGALVDMIREKLGDDQKLDLVASQEERAKLQAIKARSLQGGYDESGQCEVGKELSANSLLTAAITGQGQKMRLQMTMLSAERGCLVASSYADWNTARPKVSAAEAVAGLIDKLQVGAEMPGARAARPAGAAGAKPDDRDLGGASEEWQPEGGEKQVIVSFRSDPPGAVVMVDGNLLCQDTALGCTKEVTVGPHQVAMQKERYAKKSERVTIAEGAQVAWTLEPDYARLEVKSEPASTLR